jgi:hypothetical protein
MNIAVFPDGSIGEFLFQLTVAKSGVDPSENTLEMNVPDAGKLGKPFLIQSIEREVPS